MCVLMINEDQNDTENKPSKSGGRASTVNSAEMLKDRCTTQTEPERSPL